MIELLKKLPDDKALVRIYDQARVVDITGMNLPADLPDEKYPADIPQIIAQALEERFREAKPKPPSPKARTIKSGDSLLRVTRRRVLREIAAEITAARDRGFAEADKYVPSKGLELARQGDVEYMVSSGELKDTDLIWARNWWTGHQEQITVAIWKSSMREIFKLRQLLKQMEQSYRDEVEAIFAEKSKSEEQRTWEIEQIKVPKYLDLPEQITIEGVEQILKSRRE